MEIWKENTRNMDDFFYYFYNNYAIGFELIAV